MSFVRLGMDAELQSRLETLIAQPHGIVLVTGADRFR